MVAAVTGPVGGLPVAVRRSIVRCDEVDHPARKVAAKTRENSMLQASDIEGLIGQGVSEDEVFEAVVAGAVGGGGRILDAGLAALRAARGKP